MMRGTSVARVRWLCLAACLLSADVAMAPSHADRRDAKRPRRPCEGARPPLSEVLDYRLRNAAFPGSGHADVAVHVPHGFDASRRPGLVLYFHGWMATADSALSGGDDASAGAASASRGDDLASELDAARVNALLVAVELRVDASSGETGELSAPGRLRALLQELFEEHLG